jgi:hypothetical protein
MLFDLERIIDIRLVNDGQILGNRHRQYLLVVASAEARPPPKGDRRTGWRPGNPPVASFGLMFTHPTCQVRFASLASDRRCVGPHNVGRGTLRSSGCCEWFVNGSPEGRSAQVDAGSSL